MIETHQPTKKKERKKHSSNHSLDKAHSTESSSNTSPVHSKCHKDRPKTITPLQTTAHTFSSVYVINQQIMNTDKKKTHFYLFVWSASKTHKYTNRTFTIFRCCLSFDAHWRVADWLPVIVHIYQRRQQQQQQVSEWVREREHRRFVAHHDFDTRQKP